MQRAASLPTTTARAPGRDQMVTAPERGMAVKDGEGEPATTPSAAGAQAGKGLRAVAGAGGVDTEWTPEGPMRATVRRRSGL